MGSGDMDTFAALRAMNGPFALAVTNTKRRVLLCAENVAKANNNNDYNSSVAELVAAMDCFERVVKCAVRFTSVSEGNVEGADQDKKRRKKDFSDNH